MSTETPATPEPVAVVYTVKSLRDLERDERAALAHFRALARSPRLTDEDRRAFDAARRAADLATREHARAIRSTYAYGRRASA